MSSSKNSFIAFILNLSFSIIELIFGILFHSSAILADAVHDFGDALAIGSSAIMQAYANKSADVRYPFGYKRWNNLAAMLTSFILILGSILILFETIPGLTNPQPVNQDGMLVLGIIAVSINFLASRIVKNGHSHNEAILSLHFLEDILGWLAVILVSIILQFTDWYILDPLLSIIISLFILYKALPKAWTNIQVFLEMTPPEINLEAFKKDLFQVEGLQDIHQVRIWSLDGYEHCACLTISISPMSDDHTIKQEIRQLAEKLAIVHLTIEIS